MSDDEKSHLEEVEKPLEENTFWNSCPRKLKQFPECACPLGKAKLDSRGRVEEEPECPWGVQSEEANYCFWKLMRDRSNSDGTAEPLLQREVSNLLGYSPTKIHFIRKDAEAKLKEADPDLEFLSLEEPDADHTREDLIPEDPFSTDSEE